MKQILFNTEMVRAILKGRKTVTRRVAKPQPKKIVKNVTSYNYKGDLIAIGEIDGRIYEQVVAPYSPGDILYVRETWAQYHEHFLFKTNCTGTDFILGQRGTTIRWHPSIHMPKEAARLFLLVTNVRVERLQDITDEDAVKEGFGMLGGVDWVVYPRENFKRVWDTIIKKSDIDLYGWEANPWVWVIEFERISKEEIQ